MTMKAHTYYIIFGRPPIGGGSLPPGVATARPCKMLDPRLCVRVGRADDRDGPMLAPVPVEPRHRPHQLRHVGHTHLAQVCARVVTY